MKLLDKFGLKIKFAIILGGVAFVISLFLGVIAQVGVGIVFLRSFIFLIVFALIGYFGIYFLEKYVPEVLSLFDSKGEEDEADFQVASDEDQLNPEDEAENLDVEQENVDAESASKDGFVPFSGDEFTNLNSIPENANQASMGKHLIVDDQEMKYEPTVMAEAVRTMMQKDKE